MTAKYRKMRRVFIFLSMWCGSCVANNTSTAECAEEVTENITMEPVEGSFPGRYLIKFCKATTPSMTWEYWELTVETVDLPHENCNNNDSFIPVNLLQTHSASMGDLWDTKCSKHVCVSVLVDMVYRYCYFVKASLSSGGTKYRSTRLTPIIYYADNDVPGPEYYHSSIKIQDQTNEKNITMVKWILGNIPVSEFTQFSVQVSTIHDQISIDATSNCSLIPSQYQDNDTVPGAVRCELQWQGCAKVTLNIDEPWAQSITLGDLSTIITNKICSNQTRIEVTPLPLDLTWMWVAAGVLPGSAGLALAALIITHKRHFKRRVHYYWEKIFNESRPPVVGAAERSRRVLLVYARDCPHAMRVVDSLTKLIEAVLPHSVIDLFSPETLEETAAGEAQWLRALIRDKRTKVVVLYTPAMGCLYRDRLARQNSGGDVVPALEEPLLNICSGLVYRSPECGDALVPLTLRSLDSLGPAEASDYTKFFVATIQGIETPMVLPWLVPYRRYSLPDDAPALLHDMAPLTPHNQKGPSNISTQSLDEPSQTTLPKNDNCLVEAGLSQNDNCSVETVSPENDNCPVEAVLPQNDNCLVEAGLPLSVGCLTEDSLPPELRKHLETLRHHATELRSYLRENPNYLFTELLIVP